MKCYDFSFDNEKTIPNPLFFCWMSIFNGEISHTLSMPTLVERFKVYTYGGNDEKNIVL